ncbi:DUF3829 domain-containing protein [Microvirga aerophila]|uniref:DUF3829 domain-containing protein n=1 Tax=Microvirga aerophila TaxID=670291 RepID=A0A512BW65_9HYPH|nr:DUF3829 domain-containing protein [Microvirga aerophila]GEO16201.1 hypothetical protein MAE02_38970 [Microvirga aerophila]
MLRIWLCTLLLLSAGTLANAQTPNAAPPAPAAQAEDAALEAITAKMNAYVALMNKTRQALRSIERYESWVDMKTGPVNKNRAFGVYALFDVTNEIAAASDALKQEPKLAALDAGMGAYIKAYSELAPIIDEADGYYERKDFLDDDLKRGREIHGRLVPAIKAFLAARDKVEQDFQSERAGLAQKELAAIERREGRKANWHRANLMLAARRIVDRLPSNERPVVDMAAIEADVTSFADASRDFEEYRKTDPEALRSLQSGLRSYLAAARDFRDTLKPAKGDVRRAGSQKMQILVSSYNALAGSANNAAN